MILFYVQHLLGTGHVQRVCRIAEEVVRRGADVVIVSGGIPVPGLDVPGAHWLQLEPVRSRGFDFTDLVDAGGGAVDAALFERRRRALESAWRQWRPEVVVIETYPFGRRRFRSEVEALLDLAHSRRRTAVFCSIRDVLQCRSPGRDRETAAVVNDSFDAVLVHGDPALIALDESFSQAREIAGKLMYTGYIAPAPVPRPLVERRDNDEVVIAAGGGAAGLSLYRTAVAAARRDTLGRPWRMLVGGGVAEDDFRRLAETAVDAVRVERNRSDFRELIAASAVLVSQAGYNTVADVLVTGVPSLLVPFEGAGETEQLQRARCFERLGRCRVLREGDLDPSTLLESLSLALVDPEPIVPAVDLAGISVSADRLLAAR